MLWWCWGSGRTCSLAQTAFSFHSPQTLLPSLTSENVPLVWCLHQLFLYVVWFLNPLHTRRLLRISLPYFAQAYTPRQSDKGGWWAWPSYPWPLPNYIHMRRLLTGDSELLPGQFSSAPDYPSMQHKPEREGRRDGATSAG